MDFYVYESIKFAEKWSLTDGIKMDLASKLKLKAWGRHVQFLGDELDGISDLSMGLLTCSN